jgi:hypothetical protein
MTDLELAVYQIYYRHPDFGPKRKRLIPDRVLTAFAALWAVFVLAYLALSGIDIVDSAAPNPVTTPNIASTVTSTTTDPAFQKAIDQFCRDEFGWTGNR